MVCLLNEIGDLVCEYYSGNRSTLLYLAAPLEQTYFVNILLESGAHCMLKLLHMGTTCESLQMPSSVVSL